MLVKTKNGKLSVFEKFQTEPKFENLQHDSVTFFFCLIALFEFMCIKVVEFIFSLRSSQYHSQDGTRLVNPQNLVVKGAGEKGLGEL